MKNENGFTLIEMMIIIAMITILLSVIIPQFQQYKAGTDGIDHTANQITLDGE